MTAKGITYPQDFVRVQFARAEVWGLLEVMYLFSPEDEAGITANTAPSFRESDWFVKNITHFPEKVAYMEKIKTWATGFWPKFQAAYAASEK